MAPLLLRLLPLTAVLVTVVHGQTDRLVDPTFRPALTVAPEIVVPLADGRIYIASSKENFTVGNHRQLGLARLLADGSVDPIFDAGTGIDAGAITALDVLADGRVVLTGTFNTINGVARQTLARLLANGALDPTFQPDAALLVPSPALRYPLLDGRWIVGTVANQSLTFARFTTAGSPDATYQSGSVDLRPPPPTATFNPATSFSQITAVSRDALGRQYFGASFTSIFSNGYENFYRLNSAGELEAAILFSLSSSARAFTDQPSSETILEIDGQRALTRFSQSSLTSPPTGGSGSTGIRVRAIGPGAVNASLPSYFSSFVGGNLASLVYGFDVPAMLANDGIYVSSGGTRGRVGIVRFDFAGNFDPEFSCEIAENDYAFLSRVPLDFRVLANGQIFVRATSINGTRVNYLARLTPNRTAGKTRMSNVSARAPAGVGLQALTVGYVVANGPKKILARGAGPALVPFGVTGSLPDPVLTMYRGGAVVAENDDWSPASAATALAAGAFAFPAGSRDAALVTDNSVGAYTIQIVGKDGSTGNALAELYDLDAPPANALGPRLANFSARTVTSAGADSVIVGFTIDGNGARKILIRAIGPSFGLLGGIPPMADPVLTLYRENAAIATNGNWSDALGNNQSWSNPVYRLVEVFRTVGAFALDFRTKDAALAVTVAPGSYTAVVTSANGASGVVLLEIYEVP